MTLEQLKNYRLDREEIASLTKKLNQPMGQPEFLDNSVILDYRKGYPQPRSLVGYDMDRERAARARWTERLGTLYARTLEVEAYISAIRDSRVHRCFSLYFEDGLTERRIAHILHIERSLVSKIIRGYLQETGVIEKV